MPHNPLREFWSYTVLVRQPYIQKVFQLIQSGFSVENYPKF